MLLTVRRRPIAPQILYLRKSRCGHSIVRACFSQLILHTQWGWRAGRTGEQSVVEAFLCSFYTSECLSVSSPLRYLLFLPSFLQFSKRIGLLLCLLPYMHVWTICQITVYLKLYIEFFGALTTIISGLWPFFYRLKVRTYPYVFSQPIVGNTISQFPLVSTFITYRTGNELLRWLNGDAPLLVGINIIAHDPERDHEGRYKQSVQGVRPARETVSWQKLGCLVEQTSQRANVQ